MLNNSVDMKSGKGLTSNAIKIIGIISMTIDHTAIIFFPRYSLDIPVLFMHVIGRLVAPIMMFFITEGYHYTRNLGKYLFRLFVFAIVAHFAYTFAFGKSFIPFRETVFDQTSVLWAFGLGLLALAVYKTDKLKNWPKRIIIFISICAAFPADWSSPGALAILYMGRNRGNFKRQMLLLLLCIAMYSIGYFIFLNRVYGSMQMLIILAIPILYQYNGQRGNWKGMKWFFYIYYAGHLFILGIIRIFLLHKGTV
jgi:hypothetical protein